MKRYRYVDDIFIFAKSEELATHIVEKYSEIARKYLLQLNETKLFSSRVPFILDGWLNETNGFTNRMCIIASTANGMPFIDAKPKAIYIGRDCSDKNADCLFDIADEHEAKIYKMGFDDCVDSYELYYYEFYK